MKNKLFYLILLLLGVVAGCTPSYISPAIQPSPEGTYKGLFYLIHLNPKTKVLDTTKDNNLDLSIETATGFKVTGDTSTVHAGSYGTYQLSTTASQLVFFDTTWSGTNNSAKTHLDGVYIYTYDGVTLQMAGYGAQDTLEYYYKFTRTGK